MIDVEEIVLLYRQRKDAMAEVMAKRAKVRDAYNGDMRIALPDIGREERAAVANLVNTGLDQMAMRVASTLPTIFCPPRDETKKRELEAAKTRTRVLYGWWEGNDQEMLVPLRARQMLAYAQSPVVIRPDFKRGIPMWHVRDPLQTYPSSCLNPGDMTPEDTIFAFQRTYGWLRANYPDQFSRLSRMERAPRDAKLTLLEYLDGDEMVLVVLGDPDLPHSHEQWSQYRMGYAGTSRYELLERIENRAGVCTAVVPGRITLDKALGQFDGMLSIMARAAKLTELELIAVEKGIFPDVFLEGRAGEQPKFISGPHDGRTGLVNVVSGGSIREVGTNPGFQTNPTIDRLERAMRLDAGIPAEFGGESASNIRTGKRGDAVLSAAVDFPIQEQQKVLARSLREENKRAIAVAKGYFGAAGKSFYVSWKGAKGQVDYVPNEVFTTDENVVAYSHAGSDLNGLTIMVGQLTGMGLMSKQTGAELIPLIEDPEQEKDRSTSEAIEAALLAAFQQKANAGEIAPVDAAWVMIQVKQNKLELAEAIMKLDERVQKRQAEAMAQQADPAMADPMAGLATGTPAEAQVVPPTIAPPGESTQNLGSLLSALRRPQMTLASEEPAVA